MSPSELDFLVLILARGFSVDNCCEVVVLGKTVTVSNISGNDELIENKKNGLFDLEYSNELARIILDLYQNPAMLTDIENLALNDYDKNCPYEIFIKKYKDVYDGA